MPRPNSRWWQLREKTFVDMLRVLCVECASPTRKKCAWNTFIYGFLGVWTISVLQCAGSLTYELAVAGSGAELPCNVTTSPDDEWAVALVLWYKDNASTPLYTLDSRSGDLNTARHFPAESIAGRARYDVSRQPTVLRMSGVMESDAGQYRCRVDYRQARTENQLVELRVIVPPDEVIIVDEYGQRLMDVIGPYNEGSTVLLVCEAEGGNPLPEVTWWMDDQIIDDSFTVLPQGFVRNELTYGPLQRSDLMTRLVCQGSNNDFSVPVASAVTLDIYLKPTRVKITSSARPVSAGERMELRCLSEGAKPYAQITWFKDHQRLSHARDEVSKVGNFTASIVTFPTTLKDNGRNVTCRADNPHLPKSELIDVFILNIHYSPRLTLTARNATLQEGEDALLHCTVDANPVPNTFSWRFNGGILGTSNTSMLHLRAVSRDDNGEYECLASNSEGEGVSNTLHLSVQYAPVCKEDLKREHGASLDEIVRIACDVKANPEQVNFEWLYNTSVRSRYLSSFTTNGTRSLATVIPSSEADYGALYCWAFNAVGKQKAPCSFRLIPAGLPGPPQNCTTVILSRDTVIVQCRKGSSGGLPQVFHMEVFDVQADELHINVSSTEIPHFRLSGLPRDVSFVALLYASNAKGRSAPFTLRFSTALLNLYHTSTDQNSMKILNPVLGFIVSCCLLAACAFAALSLRKCKRRSVVEEKDIKEVIPLEKYSPEKDFMERPRDVEGRSPDLISTQYAGLDQPDIANTARKTITGQVERELPSPHCLHSSKRSPDEAGRKSDLVRWLPGDNDLVEGLPSRVAAVRISLDGGPGHVSPLKHDLVPGGSFPALETAIGCSHQQDIWRH
ncbi:hemicentin-2-like [Ornithodoros turicata]|uniref:hemicentin-2-like n=1 Tax=Ornithodoros turicata TaxID=34597 RepID=UPI0031397D34